MRILTIILGMLILVSLPTFAEDKPEESKIVLNTTAFLDEGVIPVLYTCDGKDISPQFDWSELPAKTKTIALVMTDPDAPKQPFYHWVVYNIPPSVTALEEGIKTYPAGVSVAKNSLGKAQYSGPCPPKDSVHHYVFTLFALDDKLTLPKDADGKQVVEALKKHVIDKKVLTSIFNRW